MRFLAVALLSLLLTLSYVAATPPSNDDFQPSTTSESSDSSDGDEPIPVPPPQVIRDALRVDPRFASLFSVPANPQDILCRPYNPVASRKPVRPRPPVKRRLVFNDENVDYPEFSGCDGKSCSCGCNMLLHRPRDDGESSC